MKIAIEPLHPMYCADRSVVSTMAQALDICDAVGGDVGVACDVYHIWWDPDLEAQIRRAGNRACTPSTSATGCAPPRTCYWTEA